MHVGIVRSGLKQSLVPAGSEKIYNRSAIFSPNLSKTLSAETRTGGSINSNSSLTKFSIILIEVSLKTSIGLESIGREVLEIFPKIFSLIDMPFSLHNDAIL